MAMKMKVPNQQLTEAHHKKGSCPSCKYDHMKSKADEFYIVTFGAFIDEVFHPQVELYSTKGGYLPILEKAAKEGTELEIEAMKEWGSSGKQSLTPAASWKIGGYGAGVGGAGGGWKPGAGGAGGGWKPNGYSGQAISMESATTVATDLMLQGASISMQICKEYKLEITGPALIDTARAYMAQMFIGVEKNTVLFPGQTAAVASTQPAAEAKPVVPLTGASAMADEYLQMLSKAATQDEVGEIEKAILNPDEAIKVSDAQRTILLKAANEKKRKLATGEV